MGIFTRAALPLALLLAAACAPARPASSPLGNRPPVRDSVVVEVRVPTCGDHTLRSPFRANEATGGTWDRRDQTCSAWFSVESVAGDSAALRFNVTAGTTRIEQPLVARRGPPRQYELAGGVRVTASGRTAAPVPDR